MTNRTGVNSGFASNNFRHCDVQRAQSYRPITAWSPQFSVWKPSIQKSVLSNNSKVR